MLLTISVDDLEEDLRQELDPDGEPRQSRASVAEAAPEVEPLRQRDCGRLLVLGLVDLQGRGPGNVDQLFVLLGGH